MTNTIGLIALTALVLLLCSAQGTIAENNQAKSTDKDINVTRQAENIPVSFVTLRNKTGNSSPSDFFGGQRGNLFAGTCTVSFSPIWGLEELANSVSFYIPDEKIELKTISETPVDQLLSEVKSFSREDNGNIIVYIHGYNIDFEKSCRRSAVFQRALGLDDRLLLFSWPADGNMLKYTWDEADLVWSVPHMAEFFEDLVEKSGNGKLDIVAHSLGARGAVQALVRLAYREQAGPLLNELVLIAPDIDADIFRHELPLLQGMAKRITVYVSENDKALKLSNEVHGYPRLGEAGDNLTIVEGVETVDISFISIRRLSGHLYHLFNKEVIEDLKLLLHDGTPAERRPGLKKLEHDGLEYWQLLPDDE